MKTLLEHADEIERYNHGKAASAIREVVSTMRNLMEFPITTDEVVATLRRTAAELSQEERIGDMRPIILEQAANTLEAIAKIVNSWEPEA